MKASKTKNAKRRLDLNAGTNDNDDDDEQKQKAKKEVKNSSLKPSSSAETTSSTKKMTVMTTKTASSTVTPDADVDKFLVGKRKSRDFVDEDDDLTEISKPRAARKLVTPHDVIEGPRTRTTVTRNQQRVLTTRKTLKFTSDDTDIRISGGDLYYDSDDEKSKSKEKSSREFIPVHIHSNVGYHRRGDLALDQGTLRAYRFIRNNFHIPKNLETDPKFGALSGSCFEERVIRAYSLGQLEPNGSGMHGDMNEMLLVCSYCGDEGHKRGGCSKLLL